MITTGLIVAITTTTKSARAQLAAVSIAKATGGVTSVRDNLKVAAR